MTSLVRFSPSGEMRRLQREIDNLFEGFFPASSGGEEGGPESAVWAPRVDLAESEDAYLIHLDVPGVRREDLEINFHDNTLTIKGERRVEEQEEKQNFVRMERYFGHFYRSFTLPKAADTSRIEAHYENGVLSIRVPKAEESKPRRIQVS